METAFWIENRPIINPNCKNYTDYSIFNSLEKSSIEKLCEIWIMWIHNDTTKPLTTFMVNKIVPMNEFQLVLQRTFKDYKDTIYVDIMNKVSWRTDIDLLTVYEVLLLISKSLK